MAITMAPHGVLNSSTTNAHTGVLLTQEHYDQARHGLGSWMANPIGDDPSRTFRLNLHSVKTWHVGYLLRYQPSCSRGVIGPMRLRNTLRNPYAARPHQKPTYMRTRPDHDIDQNGCSIYTCSALKGGISDDPPYGSGPQPPQANAMLSQLNWDGATSFLMCNTALPTRVSRLRD